MARGRGDVTKENKWLVTIVIASALACSLCAHDAQAASRTTPYESTRPAYVAHVRDDGSVASVTMQPAALALDMNTDNSIKGETGDFKPVTYRFGVGVLNRRSLSRIDKAYSVERIRVVPIVSSGGDWVVAEYFGAGSHTPKFRYEMLGTTVRSQYVLDRRGRTMRIADIGWRTDTADPARSGLVAGTHATWIRVFDVKKNGRPRLVAAAWTNDVRERGSDDAPPVLQELKFGDANGKPIWADQQRFEAALGLDLTARAVSVEHR
jgi:hypothetical protein